MNTASSQSASVSTRPSLPRRPLARGAAWVAAGLILIVGIIGAINPTEALADHIQGVGAASELAAGLSFLAGALSLAVLTPAGGWRGVLWMLAPIGLTVAGATMISVPVLRNEPPFWLFLLGAGLSLIGTIAAGIVGIARRVWPWWTGAALTLLMPIMFGAPFNGFFIAGVWTCVALTARTQPRAAVVSQRVAWRTGDATRNA